MFHPFFINVPVQTDNIFTLLFFAFELSVKSSTCWNAWNSIAGVTTNNSSSNEAFRKRPWEYKRPNFFVKAVFVGTFFGVFSVHLRKKIRMDLAVGLKCAQDQLEKTTDSNWSKNSQKQTRSESI